MTIGKKLFLVTGACVAATLSLGYWSTSSIRSAKQRFSLSVDTTARKLELAGRINTVKSDMMANQRALLIARMRGANNRISIHGQEFESNAQIVAVTLDEMRPLVSDAEEKRLTAIVEDRIQSWRSAYQEYTRLCEAGDANAASEFSIARIVPVYNALGEALKQLIEVTRRELEQGSAAEHAEYSSALWISWMLVGLSLACSGTVIVVVRGINGNLKSAIHELGEGASQVAKAASQVAASSQSLAQGSSEQAALLEETSAATQEINAVAHRNTEGCSGAAQLAGEARQAFAQTNTVLATTVAAMGEINASSEKISKIIKVIDEIAFQTNILALNAAVEAARAGESGMGFAVVADEVRTLAQRCAQAARDTASLIKESIGKSRDGKQKVDQVAAMIGEISENATKVGALMEAVNEGSLEESRGIDQIAKSVSQLDQLTQATAASAEQSASAAEQLTAQAKSVRVVIERLAAMVEEHGA